MLLINQQSSMQSLTLDQCLSFLAPDESLADFLGRLGAENLGTGLAAVDSHLALRPGVVLELCGPAGCGKTELLVQVGGRACACSAQVCTCACMRACMSARLLAYMRARIMHAFTCAQDVQAHVRLHGCLHKPPACVHNRDACAQAAAHLLLEGTPSQVAAAGAPGAADVVGKRSVVFLDLDNKLDVLRLIQVGAGRVLVGAGAPPLLEPRRFLPHMLGEQVPGGKSRQPASSGPS